MYNENLGEDITRKINYALMVINKNREEIKNQYSDYIVCLIECIDKGEHDLSIEVRLEDDSMTLNCLFDEQGKCDYSFLFPDSTDNIEQYINHFNNLYDYDFLQNCWIMDNCYLEIKRQKDIIGFMIFRKP